MDLIDMPKLWHFVDWNLADGINMVGIIGVLFCVAACCICWYQITNNAGPEECAPRR